MISFAIGLVVGAFGLSLKSCFDSGPTDKLHTILLAIFFILVAIFIALVR